jgi:homoserine kinase
MRIAHPSAGVAVPATSGNLGPGFDALGLALGLHDELDLEATTGGIEVEVEGEGAGAVPLGEDHLVVRSLRRALDHVGAPQMGIRLRCRNRIPHGRGLGSSAAAIALARGVISDPEALNDQVALDLATEMEGHPDNAAPALLGGATVAWTEGSHARAVRLDVDACPGGVEPVVLLPQFVLSTSSARALLPAEVPHVDAAFNAGRSALLVHALAHDPALLMAATEDRLHQQQRASGMPQSVDLVRVLRQEGYPAVISGAGPCVLVLAGADGELSHLVRDVVVDPTQWRIARVGMSQDGVRPLW